MNSLKIDTGIDWLGEVPQEWARCRLKTTVRESFNGVWGDEPKDDENDLICIRVADFNYDKLTINQNKYTVRNIPENQHNRILKKGDILIEKSGGGEKQPVGRAIIYDNEIGKAVCSNFIGKITLYKPKVIPKFVVYYLSSLYSKGINTKHIKQTTGIQNLDLESYLNESIYLPLLTEQQKIADFLDRKCALIDALIEKKQKLVELKKEERTALINQAVTKGLDPNAPMKDSGIEWLGEIPEHWEVKKLKYLINGNLKYGANEPAEIDNPDYPRYIRITDFDEDGTLRKDTFKSLPPETAEEYYLKEGDILFARSGATVGKTFQFKEYSGIACFAGYLIKATPDANQILSDYLYFFTKTSSYVNWKNGIFIQATIQNIGANKYGNLHVSLPPIDEQHKIMDFIISIHDQTNYIINSIERQVELLKEYKTTLISEVVTGKFEI